MLKKKYYVSKLLDVLFVLKTLFQILKKVIWVSNN